YGIAVVVGLYRSFAKLLDFEIPGGALPKLAVAFAKDEAQGWAIFRTTLGLQVIVAAAGAILLPFGPYLPWLSSATKAFPALPAMFAVAALQHVTDTLSSTLSLPFLAREQFKRLAFFESFLATGATFVMLALVLILRSPLALILGTAIESAVGLGLKFILFRRYEPRNVLLPALQKNESREILGAAWRVYLTNFSGLIGARAEKAIIESVLGPAALTIYQFGSRIPQQALEILTRLSEAITPNMAATAAHDPGAFGALLRKNALTVATVAASGVIALGALGTPLVQTWIRSEFPIPEAGLVVLFMAVYSGMELHFSTLTRAFYATGRILWMLPFTLFHTTVTLAASAPLARSYGIVGVAAMNMAIDLVQFVPITYITLRILAPRERFAPFLLRTALILGVGAFMATLGWAMTGHVAPGRTSLYWCFALGIPGAVTLAVLLGSRVGLMPSTLWNRLPAPVRRFAPHVLPED
ncbi:MAG: hypothetical protein C4320_03995, partial [Armatimonadota bacterium]